MKFGKQKKNNDSGRQPIPGLNKTRYSYSSNRSARVERTNRRKDLVVDDTVEGRNKVSKIHHIPTLIGIILLICGLLYMTTLNNDVQITTKDKNESILREQSKYKEIATAFINKSPINRSKLLFDSKGLTNELKKQFPELSAVSVTVPIFSRRPVITIQTTRLGFILISGKESYIIGTNGVALVNVNDTEGVVALGLRTVSDNSGVDIKIGKSALPQEQAMFISTVVEQLEKQNIKVDSLSIPKSPYDLHVRIVGEKYYVKFNILEDAKQQSGAFIALKNKLSSEGKIPAEYIDVRVGERVFYK